MLAAPLQVMPERRWPLSILSTEHFPSRKRIPASEWSHRLGTLSNVLMIIQNMDDVDSKLSNRRHIALWIPEYCRLPHLPVLAFPRNRLGTLLYFSDDYSYIRR